MKPRSLRARLIIASVLWTAGLLAWMHMLSLMLVKFFPRVRGSHSIGVLAFGALVMIFGFRVARTSLTPFRRLRTEVHAVRDDEDRRIAGEYPTEVEPLVSGLNELLDERQKAVRRAHAAAGDLAHGLKTPLALLNREASLARDAGQAVIADAIEAQVRRMTGQVDRHLARARAAATSASASCPVAPCVEALLRTMDKLHAGRELAFEAEVDPSLRVRAGREELDEMLGNLLDNACKWSRSRVRVSAAISGGRVVITVDDDGPGIDPALRQAVLERGIRADEAAPGSGLGLAIVSDLVQAHGGRVSLGESPWGGLRVEILLARA